MNTEIKKKTNRISKSIFEFSDNQEQWKEAFNEFVIAQPLKLNHVPVLGHYNCVCGAKIKHGRIYINKHNKNQIWIGGRCEEYIIKNNNSVITKNTDKSIYNSNSNIEHIKKCIVENEDFRNTFICNYCYWILPKTHKQKGFSNKCSYCFLKCKFCEGLKEKEWQDKCSSCYFKEKQYNKCHICNKYKIKPNTTFTKCYDCLTNNKRRCSNCGKYKVSKTTKFDNCFDCNKIQKGKK